VDLARRDRRDVEDKMSDFVERLHGEGKAPGYIANHLKAVRSWLQYNEVTLVRKIKIRDRDSAPTLSDERVPTGDELRKILLYATERGRCSISLMAYSGLRPEVLGNMRGVDGLKIGDLPEVSMRGGEVVFQKVPTMVVVRSSLSKAGHRFFSFLGGEGCECLRALLEKRLAEGEQLRPETAIITVKRGYELKGGNSSNLGSRFITTKNVTREIREAMRPVFKWRPYVLRAYFDTQLMVAENQGRISHTYRQFFMGHSGDMEARYTTHKGRLPEDVVEDMRRSYASCEEYLSTTAASKEDPELTTIKTMVESGMLDLSKPKVRQYLVKKLGIDDMDVKVAKMRERGLGEDEADIRVICGELGVVPMNVEMSKPKDNGDPKKIVDEDELESHLAEGWDVQTVLPSGKILIRK